MTNALKPSYSPADLLGAAIRELDQAGITIDPEDMDSTKATLAVVGLLMALGIEPQIAEDDHSAAAELVREIALESRVRTTTRARRAL